MSGKLLMTMAALLLPGSLPAGINFDGRNNTGALKEAVFGVERSVPAPPSPEPDNKALKEWTIMVYVNGKNNLEEYALKDMNEMEMVGSSDQVNIVTEIGRMAGHDTSNGDWKGSRRYLVRKDSDTRKVTSPVVRNLGKADMGDYNHLIDFGNWAKAAYPAKKYMLVVWNHGSGWDKAGAFDVNRGISYDDETSHHISTPQLGLALKGIGGVNVYGSDACLMQMQEVAYELMGSAEYIVGSEETEPGDGYTYDLLLYPVVRDPVMTPRQLGKLAVDAYSDYYQSINGATTQSVLKAAALPGFLAAVNDFVTAAMAAREGRAIKSAVSSAQSFSVRDNKDLGHFLQLYAGTSENAEVKAKIKALQDYLLGTLVMHNRVNGSYTDAHGLSVYLPDYQFNMAYNELAWARASRWDEFINWYAK